MAAGAQNLLLALAVPLISPFELQHQIFREHPAPEQLFLIATPQHCCPCLYINIYSEPRTEHQSSALPPPPAPALPLQPLAGQEGGCAETDLGPTVLLLPHRFGRTRPCPCAVLPARHRQKRELPPLPSLLCPAPAAPGAASLGAAALLPLTATARTAPPRQCLGTA